MKFFLSCFTWVNFNWWGKPIHWGKIYLFWSHLHLNLDYYSNYYSFSKYNSFSMVMNLKVVNSTKMIQIMTQWNCRFQCWRRIQRWKENQIEIVLYTPTVNIGNYIPTIIHSKNVVRYGILFIQLYIKNCISCHVINLLKYRQNCWFYWIMIWLVLIWYKIWLIWFQIPIQLHDRKNYSKNHSWFAMTYWNFYSSCRDKHGDEEDVASH